MYGLLLEGIYYYLRTIFGEDNFREIREKANISHTNFSTHQVYSETVIPRLARAAQEVTGMPQEEVMESFGISFVSYVTRYGYDRILKVLGRSLRDFLANLDNLHEPLRFSYPKIKAPSFFVTDETVDGLTLHYRSKRRGFKSYLRGQLRQVGKELYSIEIKCEELQADESLGTSYTQMRLSFDNTETFSRLASKQYKKDMHVELPITNKQFFNLFPFHMVLNRDLLIISVGIAMNSVLPHLVGSQLDDLFHLERPIIDFNWDMILFHTNNVFELHSVDIIENRYEEDDAASETTVSQSEKYDEGRSIKSENSSAMKRTLVLRGQMLYMEEWQAILFLGTPVMENLDHMFRLGLYINDLSIHDSSRELVLAGTQQSAELKLLLDQEQVKSKKLEESLKRLDTEMKKTDQLLYQMIPKSVADRLRSGEHPVSTCEVFDSCTILFSDVVGFTNICSAISPMQVVNMLNGMYTTFDMLIEKHQLYKVETIGDAYMIVGGVPKPSEDHAMNVAEMAFAMLNAMKTLKDPSDRTGKGHLSLRVGIHSGTVVAGVVGLKMPRYCLFGDAVNTASKMESNSEPMRVHISEDTRVCLLDYPQYKMIERGLVEIKGKGSLTTYFLSKCDILLSTNGHQNSGLSPSRTQSLSPKGSLRPIQPATSARSNVEQDKSSHSLGPNLKSISPRSPRSESSPDTSTSGNAEESPTPALSSAYLLPQPPSSSQQAPTSSPQLLTSSPQSLSPIPRASSPQPHTSSEQPPISQHVSFQNSTITIPTHVYNVPPIAAVEPSPVKPVAQQQEDLLQRARIPGYGEQRCRSAKPNLITPTTKVCSSACAIL